MIVNFVLFYTFDNGWTDQCSVDGNKGLAWIFLLDQLVLRMHMPIIAFEKWT